MQTGFLQELLKGRRAKTDLSLTQEREKTDESLENRQSAAEVKTDQAVQRDRDQGGSSSISAKRQQHLRTEVDTAIEHERAEKGRILSELVQREREATDRNLQGERSQTDSEAKFSDQALANEQAAHNKAKNAVTTRDEFVAIVSHDLRNPLGAILSAAEILEEEASSLGPETLQWIEMIKRNAQASLRLISDILDMEKIVEGQLQLDWRPHSAQRLLQEALESCQHAAQAKSITLSVLSVQEFDLVKCDKDRISQVLSNLIGNAIKFTPNHGSVTLSCEGAGAEMIFNIRDTGPGVPKEQQARIFQRYTQLQNKDRAGLGLGLYISKMLVEAHGGRLWVNSSGQDGSEFAFSLPICSTES